jgi:hypothetical protein
MTETPLQNQNEDESLVQNDEIIGVAFKRSLIGVGAIIVIGVVVYFVVSRESPAPPPNVAPAVGAMQAAREATPPNVMFTDITSEAGIEFVHRSGATGEKLLPETMGGGCAFLDYDGDGDEDMLFVSGRQWPFSGAEDTAPSLALYANDGSGRFTDVTAEAGLTATLQGMGVAVGDIENDGDTDVFVTTVGENWLFRNEGGRFIDATGEAGVAGAPNEWSTSAGFFDADNDGDLDLFVCNYVKWSREIDFEVNYTLTGVGRAYGPPTNFEGSQPYLYINDGAGQFTEMAESAGLFVTNPATGLAVGKSLAVIFVDLDGDRLSEIIVANDTTRNFLYRNLGDGQFEEIGSTTGVAYDSMGGSTGAMGIDAARFRDDTALGVAIGNFANEMTSFYVSDADVWQFIDAAIAEGVGAPSRAALSFGLFFFDYDLDGRLDLFQTNGHLEEEINIVQPSQQYRQPSQLFWNAGADQKSTYVLVDGASTGALATPVVGRGAAYADIDADGDLDVLVTQINDRPMLLRNDLTADSNWVRVSLTGTESNRDAIGAKVVARIGERTVERIVAPTRSYVSQVELPVTIGLGGADSIDQLTVTWPSGHETVVGSVEAGQTLHLTEGDG